MTLKRIEKLKSQFVYDFDVARDDIVCFAKARLSGSKIDRSRRRYEEESCNSHVICQLRSASLGNQVICKDAGDKTYRSFN